MHCKLPFAPPKPNALTAAKSPGIGVTSVHTFKRPSTNAVISFFGVLKYRFGGTIPSSNAKITLVIEQRAELPSLWPIFDFTDPISKGSSRLVQNILSIVLHSSGSPTLVPLICHIKELIEKIIKIPIFYDIIQIE